MPLLGRMALSCGGGILLQNTAILCTFHIISVSAENYICSQYTFLSGKEGKCKKEVNCEGGEVGGESVGQNAGKASARGVTTPILWVSILCIVCIVCR